VPTEPALLVSQGAGSGQRCEHRHDWDVLLYCDSSKKRTIGSCPNAPIVWFDDQTGEGLIRRDAREYPVTSSDIDTSARVPNAAVHCDIVRHEGVRWAVKVTLRREPRVATRQHRFEDPAGAHHPDEKGHHPPTDDRPGVYPAYEGRPMELVEEWARLVNLGDLSTLRLLYAPEAFLHEERKRVVGRDAIIEQMSARHSGSRLRRGSSAAGTMSLPWS
jgi:hypothetical protein